MATEPMRFDTRVPKAIQIKIFSYLSVIDLIQNVNVLSKEYNSMVSNDSVLWHQLNVRHLSISTLHDYGEIDHISKSISIDGTELEDPPTAFLSKIKYIPMQLNTLHIHMVAKSGRNHAMRYIRYLFVNYLSIHSVHKVSFWSYPAPLQPLDFENNVVSQTQMY
eukprot:157103_1